MGALLDAGTKLGRYEVIKHLATGGMADLWLARATGLEGFERHVVIKRIRAELENDQAFVEMFLTEARLAAALHHHNIVQVHDIGQELGKPYFAMEYVHGEDLRNLLALAYARGEQVPLQHVITIVSAVATALHYAHEQKGADRKSLGIVHRDVTPANILVGYDGNVKVVDFGIARAATRRIKTQAGMLAGKSPYMAPEQCTGGAIDRRSDVFALGIVLFELATCRRLFKGANEFRTMSAIVKGTIPRPSDYRRDLPPSIDEIILRALAREPAARYQTAEQVFNALDEVATKEGLRTSATALAAYMKQLFGARSEPWLVHDATAYATASVDFDGAEVGLVVPPAEDLDAQAVPTAGKASRSSPIARAQESALGEEPAPSPRAQARALAEELALAGGSSGGVPAAPIAFGLARSLQVRIPDAAPAPRPPARVKPGLAVPAAPTPAAVPARGKPKTIRIPTNRPVEQLEPPDTVVSRVPLPTPAAGIDLDEVTTEAKTNAVATSPRGESPRGGPAREARATTEETHTDVAPRPAEAVGRKPATPSSGLPGWSKMRAPTGAGPTPSTGDRPATALPRIARGDRAAAAAPAGSSPVQGRREPARPSAKPSAENRVAAATLASPATPVTAPDTDVALAPTGELDLSATAHAMAGARLDVALAPTEQVVLPDPPSLASEPEPTTVTSAQPVMDAPVQAPAAPVIAASAPVAAAGDAPDERADDLPARRQNGAAGAGPERDATAIVKPLPSPLVTDAPRARRSSHVPELWARGTELGVRPLRRRRWWVGGIGAVLVIAIGAFAVTGSRSERAELPVDAEPRVAERDRVDVEAPAPSAAPSVDDEPRPVRTWANSQRPSEPSTAEPSSPEPEPTEVAAPSAAQATEVAAPTAAEPSAAEPSAAEPSAAEPSAAERAAAEPSAAARAAAEPGSTEPTESPAAVAAPTRVAPASDAKAKPATRKPTSRRPVKRVAKRAAAKPQKPKVATKKPSSRPAPKRAWDPNALFPKKK